jgi:hypothetical protein
MPLPAVEPAPDVSTIPIPEPMPYLADPYMASEPLPESEFAPVFGYESEYTVSGPAVEPAATNQSAVVVISRLVDGLLYPASERNLAERTVTLVDGLRQLADMLLGGAGVAGAADALSTTSNGLAAEVLRLVDGLLYPGGFGQALTERVAGLVGNLLGLVDGLLGEGGTSGPVPAPSYPHAPVAPVPAPSYPTSFSSNGSPAFGSEGTASVLLLAVLASSLVVLLLVGKHSWTSRAVLRPSSVLRLVAERPG